MAYKRIAGTRWRLCPSILATVIVILIKGFEVQGQVADCSSTTFVDVDTLDAGVELALNSVATGYVTAGYTYHFISFQFINYQKDQSYIGLEKFFIEGAIAEFGLAQMVKQYISDRGGCVSFPLIEDPTINLFSQEIALTKAIGFTIASCDELNTLVQGAEAVNDTATAAFGRLLLEERIAIVKKLVGYRLQAVNAKPKASDRWLYDRIDDFDWSPLGKDVWDRLVLFYEPGNRKFDFEGNILGNILSLAFQKGVRLTNAERVILSEILAANLIEDPMSRPRMDLVDSPIKDGIFQEVTHINDFTFHSNFWRRIGSVVIRLRRQVDLFNEGNIPSSAIIRLK
ncbi:unnamed protein product [Owenia fusiformis]|uniref:Ferritin/DPS domain-containing protein n=1 Tax=Owenia fusiformis TaxID=6347 RepID=A0A8J1XZW5_OWEFU|nr:unnamed protein product [Owenia fusiformis]